MYRLAEYILSSHNLVIFLLCQRSLTIKDDVGIDGLISFRFRIREKFILLLRERIYIMVLSVSVSTENTTACAFVGSMSPVAMITCLVSV